MININKITSRQKLIIAKGLLDYQYIMDNWHTNSMDFQEVYYDFYLKARWSVMSNPNNNEPYFSKLQSIKADANLIDIIIDLKKIMAQQSLEFSLSTKLLHTRNPNFPIYDSKVRIYLSEQENVEFWWGQTNRKMYGNLAPKNTTKINKIKHDWENLCSWYNEFLDSQRGKTWVAWFDSNFPYYKNISNVKKIDFIIFATT